MSGEQLYCVYVLRNSRAWLYIGLSEDVTTRVQQAYPDPRQEKIEAEIIANKLAQGELNGVTLRDANHCSIRCFSRRAD